MFDSIKEQLVPIRFEWRYGGHQVHLCGSFTRWLETVPMAPDHASGASVFAVVCNLPPGVHQYKFIVDGEWCHDESQPYMPDPLGNVNNWIFVAAPGTTTTSGGATSNASNEMRQQLQPLAQSTAAGMNIPNSSPGAVKQITAEPSASSSSCMDWTSSNTSETVGNNPASSTPITGSAPASLGLAGDVCTGNSDPEVSRSRVAEFLHRHTAYELIPESAKVVVLDTALPVQQAFHALFEQGLPSAPLWDESAMDFVGIISSSDFINILHRLRQAPLSNEELENLTISKWRHELSSSEGEGFRRLVSVRPEDSLHAVARTLLHCGFNSVPILTFSSMMEDKALVDQSSFKGREIAQLLHLATLDGIFASITRHYRHTPSALPLLTQSIGHLGVGTYREDFDLSGKQPQIVNKTPLHTLLPTTPLTVAMSQLLQAGVSALPVVDEQGLLVDVYARSDVMALARGEAYSRLPLDEISVSQALGYCAGGNNARLPTPPVGSASSSPSSSGSHLAAQGTPRKEDSSRLTAGPDKVGKIGRCHTCTRTTTLRVVVEALATPGVQRLICVEPNSRRLEGLISLRDVALFLFA